MLRAWHHSKVLKEKDKTIQGSCRVWKEHKYMFTKLSEVIYQQNPFRCRGLNCRYSLNTEQLFCSQCREMLVKSIKLLEYSIFFFFFFIKINSFFNFQPQMPMGSLEFCIVKSCFCHFFFSHFIVQYKLKQKCQSLLVDDNTLAVKKNKKQKNKTLTIYFENMNK